MDIPRLEQLLNDLHVATGMDTAIVDGSFRVLARRHSGMDFCTRIHTSAKCLDVCMASDNEQISRAERTGKTVCYTCPFGIFEAITPIFRNGRVIAYLFLSMGIREGEDCRQLPVRQALAVSPGLDGALLERALEEVPVRTGKQLAAYCGLLAVTADYIENNDLLSGPEQSLGQLAKNYIRNDLAQKITLSELSYRLGCSTVTLTTRFKEEFGITVMEYVMQKRMSLARQLLRENAWSVAQIAEKCGFSDPEYFSKCFKRYFGLPPMAWKKQDPERP